MKKQSLYILMLWCCVLLSTQLQAQTPFGVNGPLTLQGVNIVNQYGRPIQLRGMSTHGLQYRGNCYTDESLDVLANAWGVDIVRLSMYVREGGYIERPAYWNGVIDNLITKVSARGLYILLDWHMLHPGDPNADLELAKSFFAYMSAKHKDKANIIYEICNEPNDAEGVVTWPMIKSYAEQVIPIVRANAPNALIVVGTPGWCSRPNDAIGDALNYPNILYTTHVYVADYDQGERMENTRKALAAGLPVFVTEWGTQDGWGDGANDFPKAQAWINFMAANKISWCNWNYSDSPLSGAAWKNGTCPNGPWTDDNLKESGLWIKAHVNYPADSWSSTEDTSKLLTPIANGTYTLATGVPFTFSVSPQVSSVLLYNGSPAVNFAALNAPFEYTWFPPAAGAHVVTCEYYDKDGNFLRSGTVHINVTSGARLNFTKPAANASVRGEIHINAFASDPTAGTPEGSGIATVRLELIKGASVVASRLEGGAPYDWYLNTSTFASGSYTLKATSTSTAAAGGDVASVSIPVKITGTSARLASAPEATTASEADEVVHVYPVPSSGIVNIAFTLSASAAVELTLTDINGKPVHTLVHRTLDAGNHRYQWDTAPHKPGLYLYQLKIDGRIHTGKVVVTK